VDLEEDGGLDFIWISEDEISVNFRVDVSAWYQDEICVNFRVDVSAWYHEGSDMVVYLN
jgi:hypothetical protein